MSVFIEKSYIAALILNVKSKYLRKEFITLEELNYISNQFQKKLNEQNFNAIILDRIDTDYFDISDVIKINKSKGLSLESILTRYQGYLDLDILLLIWNKDTIFDYLSELKKIESINEDKQIFDVMAVPCSRAFVVRADKAEEFKNSSNIHEENAFVREMSQTFIKNNLVEEGLVLKKTRKPDIKYNFSLGFMPC